MDEINISMLLFTSSISFSFYLIFYSIDLFNLSSACSSSCTKCILNRLSSSRCDKCSRRVNLSKYIWKSSSSSRFYPSTSPYSSFLSIEFFYLYRPWKFPSVKNTPGPPSFLDNLMALVWDSGLLSFLLWLPWVPKT